MPSDKQTVSVRLPEDLLAFVDRIAAEQERSRNWVIVDLVRRVAEANQVRRYEPSAEGQVLLDAVHRAKREADQ